MDGSGETSEESADKSTDDGKIDYETLSVSELEVLSYDNDAEAEYRLGQIYDYGTDEINQNFEAAAEWYLRAASHSSAKAYTALGYFYLNGISVERSLPDAVSLFTEARRLRDKEALVGLGRVYLYAYENQIVIKDDEAGEDDRDTADDEAGEDDSDAAEEGNSFDTYAEQAYLYLHQAHDRGLPDGTYYLAYLYEKGIGTEADIAEALALYQTLTDPEDTLSLDLTNAYIPDAARVRTGLLYENGDEEMKNPETAFSYFEAAAENGYALAEYYLGLMYYMGSGVEQSDDEAFRYIMAAAEQELSPALNQIGYFYYNGTGTDRDLRQTVYYQKRAAAQGYTPAQVNLGYLYENGYGVEMNLSTALSYYQLAAEKGYEGASEAVLRVETLLNE